MYIYEETIADVVSELFRSRVPKRLVEYWNDQYTGITSPAYITSWEDLSWVLRSEYEAYAIGTSDSEERQEILCSHCIAKNEYARKTGYNLELQPYEAYHS